MKKEWSIKYFLCSGPHHVFAECKQFMNTPCDSRPCETCFVHALLEGKKFQIVEEAQFHAGAIS